MLIEMLKKRFEEQWQYNLQNIKENLWQIKNNL